MGFDHYGVTMKRRTSPKGGGIPSSPPSGYPLDGAANVEGKGPLSGWLRPNPGAGQKFADGGNMWCDCVDAWGNPFLLLVGDKQGNSLYDVDADHVGGIALSFGVNGRAKLAPQQRAIDAYKIADAAIMSSLGWTVDGSPANGPGQGIWTWDLSGDPYLTEGANYSALSVGMVNSGGKRWRELATTENSGIVNGDLLAPLGADPASFIQCAYIDNVPVQLAVDPQYKNDFPGWVICRVNRYTRTAVITGLLWHGFGTAQAYDAYRSNPDQLLIAIGKTLLGLVQIVVGVIVAIYGGGTGVALIISGIATIVSAWFDFAKAIQQHAQVVQNAIAQTVNYKLLAKVKDQLLNQKDAASGPQSSSKFSLAKILPFAGLLLPFVG